MCACTSVLRQRLQRTDPPTHFKVRQFKSFQLFLSLVIAVGGRVSIEGILREPEATRCDLMFHRQGQYRHELPYITVTITVLDRVLLTRTTPIKVL